MTEMQGPAYDAIRGGAIWDQRMSSDDGVFVASWMVEVLREMARGVHHPDGWQIETLTRSFDDGADPIWLAVACNVLIEMFDDFKAQVAEAKARGEEVPAA
jgi:hypothetical protein